MQVKVLCAEGSGERMARLLSGRLTRVVLRLS